MKTIFVLVVLMLGISSVSIAQKGKGIDTNFSKEQFIHIKNLKYRDLIKFHGHSCDSLLEGMQALQLGLKYLYPDGIIDIANTRIISKPSPCLADAVIYPTKGRYQYGSFYTTIFINGIYIIGRIDNGKTVKVSRNDWVKPTKLDRLQRLANEQKLNHNELKNLQTLEYEYIQFLRSKNPELNFTVKDIGQFEWESDSKMAYVKMNIINENLKK